MKEIETRSDLDFLLIRFYQKAIRDQTIGFIFTDVAKLNLEHHLPVIGDFWESLLFGTGDYLRHGRNPLQIHAELNLRTPLLETHFRRWLELFTETVDESFVGERADLIKVRAAAIAHRMFHFVNGSSAVEFNGERTAVVT